jgi:glycosyltransferase involved in cell wall biosynthesis
MHVLTLCKRQYTARDLLDDRYGRMYEIPEGLARLGHQVSGLTLSYRRRPDHQHESPAGVQWRSINVLPGGPWQLARAVRSLRGSARPDVVLAGSDAPTCVLGRHIARYLGLPLVLDLYDNYEHFGLTRIPGMRRAFRYACRGARGLSVISHTLAGHLRDTVVPLGEMRVIGNGVRTDLFHPMDRRQCREHLGLPLHATLIGCAGALDASRGIKDMFKAFLELAEQRPDLHLVVAGPRDRTLQRYQHPRIVDLGVLHWQQIPAVINSLDISIVCNRESTFGRYCFPLKLYESVACGVPVVASGVGDVPRLLPPDAGITYPAGDHRALAAAIEQLLGAGSVMFHASVADWQVRAAQMEELLTASSMPPDY